MPLYAFRIDDCGHAETPVEEELADIGEARRMATVLAGEILRDRPSEFWRAPTWSLAVTVTDTSGAPLFGVKVVGQGPPASPGNLG